MDKFLSLIRYRFPIFRLIGLAFLCMFVLTCTEKPGQESAQAGNTVDRPSFTIAILPEQNVFIQKRQYMPLARYLSDRLDMNVKTKLLDSYDAVYSEMAEKKVEAAFFGSLSYVVMNSKIDINPIARPLRKDGVSTYKGVIVGRKDAGITNDVRTWKGKKIALVHESTTAGYIFPKWYLLTKGIKDFDRYFSHISYLGSHDAVMLAVSGGEADMGSAKDSIIDFFFEKHSHLRDELLILAVSEAVPSNTLGLRGDLAPELEKSLREALLNMDRRPEGEKALERLGAVRFIETAKSDYQPVVRMLESLGLSPEYFTLSSIGRKVEPDAGQDTEK